MEMVPEDEFGGEECPECGAPPGEPHDPRCPLAVDDEDPRDPDRAYDARVDREPRMEGVIKESTEFDKFMDKIVVDERRRQQVDRPETNPQRLIAKRYQDRPMNKTRFTRGGR